MTHADFFQGPVQGLQPLRPNQTLALLLAHFVVIHIFLHVQVDHFFALVEILFLGREKQKEICRASKINTPKITDQLWHRFQLGTYHLLITRGVKLK